VILYTKHLLLMSLALLAVPIVGRVFARFSGRAHRVLRPGVGFVFVLSRLLLALAVPLLAQGAYAGLSAQWPNEAWNRLAALAFAGAVYGAFFGDEQDFPRFPGAIWGAFGGLGTALLYELIPSSSEGRALCVALFATVPLLAYRPFNHLVRRKLSSGGLISPNRRILR